MPDIKLAYVILDEKVDEFFQKVPYEETYT
jgi:hypothetical protein